MKTFDMHQWRANFLSKPNTIKESKLQQGFDQINRSVKKSENLMRIANELFPEFDGELVNFKPLDNDQIDQVYIKYTEEGLD